MTDRSTTTSNPAEVFYKPSGRWWWVTALVMTPVFFLIALSFQDEAPFSDKIAGRALLIAMTAYPLASQATELAMWHLREHLDRPIWWTAKRQNNLGHAILLSGLFAILRLSPDSVGWGAVGEMLGLFCIAVLPFFALCQAVDAVLARIGCAFTGRKAS